MMVVMMMMMMMMMMMVMMMMITHFIPCHRNTANQKTVKLSYIPTMHRACVALIALDTGIWYVGY